MNSKNLKAENETLKKEFDRGRDDILFFPENSAACHQNQRDETHIQPVQSRMSIICLFFDFQSHS